MGLKPCLSLTQWFFCGFGVLLIANGKAGRKAANRTRNRRANPQKVARICSNRGKVGKKSARKSLFNLDAFAKNSAGRARIVKRLTAKRCGMVKSAASMRGMLETDFYSTETAATAAQERAKKKRQGGALGKSRV